MTNGLAIKTTLGEAPSRLQLDFGKICGDSSNPANEQLWRSSVCHGYSQQQHVVVPPDNPQTVAPTLIFTGCAERVTVAINASATDIGEIELGQERIDESWLITTFAPARASIGHLFNDQELMGGSTGIGRSNDGKSTIVYFLLRKQVG